MYYMLTLNEYTIDETIFWVFPPSDKMPVPTVWINRNHVWFHRESYETVQYLFTFLYKLKPGRYLSTIQEAPDTYLFHYKYTANIFIKIFDIWNYKT